MALHELCFSGRRVPVQIVLLGNLLQNLEPCLTRWTSGRKLFNDLPKNQKTKSNYLKHFVSLDKQKKEGSSSITNCTIDTGIGTELRRNHDEFFSIFCTKQVLDLNKIRHFWAPRSSKDDASNSFSQLSRAFPIRLKSTFNAVTCKSTFDHRKKSEDSLLTFKDWNTGKNKLAEQLQYLISCP